MPSLEAYSLEQIKKLEQSGRLRRLPGALPAGMVSFGSNDYLGLSQHPAVIAAAQAAAGQYGAGAGASRLVCGDYPLLSQLEAKLAEAYGAESAMVFGSGYLTSIGVIPALVGKGDLILADKLIHACMLDGAALSNAKLKRFRHNDVAHLKSLLAEHRPQYRQVLVLTESIFSMDGDAAPEAEIAALCTAHDAWLLVDRAHQLDTRATKTAITMGTLSKAYGSYGGFVAGSAALVQYLRTAARSAMFTTALPPAAVGAALKALEIAKAEAWRAEKAIENAYCFSNKFQNSSIVPHVVGSNEAALALSAKLRKAGFFVPAIRPPTVPEGTARLRFSFTALQEMHHIKEVIACLKS